MFLETVLERLAEMFPKSNYQTRLESYINSKYPTNAAEVEYWARDYETKNNALHWGRGL
jgi:hypothetical protein